LFWRACYEAKNFLSQKRLGQAFWFLKPFMKWNFSFTKGPCILFFKMPDIFFFFPLVPFGRITRKEKRKKKKEPPYGALCWIKPED
jgi:hypothetical protein